MIKKEIFWVIGTFLLVLLLNLLIFGNQVFNEEAFIDINYYDTYYIIKYFDFLIISSAFIFFVIYLIRAIVIKFKNNLVNIILICSTIILLIILNRTEQIFNYVANQYSGWTIYPPLSVDSTLNEEINQTHRGNYFFEIITKLLLIIEILLMLFVSFVGYKIGQTKKLKTKD